MAKIDVALRELDADYQARRNALLAEQQQAEQRAAELAKLKATHTEEEARQQSVDAACSSLDEQYRAQLAPLIEDLIGDTQAAQAKFGVHWTEIQALIAMAAGFQARAEALAQLIGKLARSNMAAFEDNAAMVDYIGHQIGLLPAASDLNVAPADVVPTDEARVLGIRVLNPTLLTRAYHQRASAGIAEAARDGRA